MIDFEAIRSQFPILDQNINGHPLVYLDSAATSQKPQCVIDAETEFYRTINAGVHRGAHELAARATMAFEDGRAKVSKLVGGGIGGDRGGDRRAEPVGHGLRQRIAEAWWRSRPTFCLETGRRDRRVPRRASFGAAAVPGIGVPYRRHVEVA